MEKFKLKTYYKQLLADTITPVSVYLKIRDRYPNSLLLESSDYHSSENSYSYICCNPIASYQVNNGHVEIQYPDGARLEFDIDENKEVVESLTKFVDAFDIDNNPVSFINNGLFGYIGYDAVKYFEDIPIDDFKTEDEIPDIVYTAYQNIIVINHFKNEAFIFSHNFGDSKENIAEIQALIYSRNVSSYQFSAMDDEACSCTDKEYLEQVKYAKQHAFKGDTFQMVLSRRYNRGFEGDDFNVYRALRSVNPSPYLFYFDFGSFKLFGSSPEAQIIVSDGKATIHPIAGTFKRTGNDKADREAAIELVNDPKENAEHVMLVDLARNDLSRHGEDVKVESYKEIQYYSHVIHLVSKVTAAVKPDASMLQLVADTFPAGTLSGAPKVKAMQLINQYEKINRGYYGGCIGFMGFNGEFNNAILIRSFFSKDNRLNYQAGAGIVSESIEENELQEVTNKLGALRLAISLAENINK